MGITHSWNGTVLTITSDSGTSSCDLKGEKGDTGIRGVQGIQGEKGERGTGEKGEKGDAFTFADFTPEQLEGLRGAEGPAGKDGTDGSEGPVGPAGKGVPTGGSKGQVLSKVSENDYDCIWAEAGVNFLDIYPIGSIYMSVESTSPASLFGGTWEQLKDRFLLGAGDSYSVGSTGGEAEHTLTVDEMPKHRHETSEGNTGFLIDVGTGVNHAVISSIGSYPLNTGYTGGDEPHNNMPPYLAVYMWKRVA